MNCLRYGKQFFFYAQFYQKGVNSMNNMELQIQQLMNNPEQFVKQAGWNIPPEIIGDPQKMVMHLIQTGQVGGAAMQRILPMIRQMNVR